MKYVYGEIIKPQYTYHCGWDRGQCTRAGMYPPCQHVKCGVITAGIVCLCYSYLPVSKDYLLLCIWV